MLDQAPPQLKKLFLIKRIFDQNAYLSPNAFIPVLWLDVEVLHVDLRPLPGGVCEAVEGKPNQLLRKRIRFQFN